MIATALTGCYAVARFTGIPCLVRHTAKHVSIRGSGNGDGWAFVVAPGVKPNGGAWCWKSHGGTLIPHVGES